MQDPCQRPVGSASKVLDSLSPLLSITYGDCHELQSNIPYNSLV
jgi:hypothetical protein